MWPFHDADRRRRFEREALPHLDACYRFALALTRDAAEADDLVQETMLRAFRAFDSYTEGTRCKAWLFRILKNVFLNRRRTDGREVDLEESLGAIQELGWEDRPFYRSPEDAVLLAATRDRIEEALGRMPRDFREAVVLADVEGLSYQEIAEVMGTPIGTVMSRIHRGRRMLRSLLGESLGILQETLQERPHEAPNRGPGQVIPLVATREGRHDL
ncbi:MAG TPA: sigma-70 family RNA polymerase sigma factor [Myxococcota bacterium]|nr:sigma-70 family RNA polymerase sigma factor [Myxococcota bacterium]HQK49693.1 sigma-70 family RNA polymerase sigma factor [Myxococcota bacterium]